MYLTDAETVFLNHSFYLQHYAELRWIGQCPLPCLRRRQYHSVWWTTWSNSMTPVPTVGVYSKILTILRVWRKSSIFCCLFQVLWLDLICDDCGFLQLSGLFMYAAWIFVGRGILRALVEEQASEVGVNRFTIEYFKIGHYSFKSRTLRLISCL